MKMSLHVSTPLCNQDKKCINAFKYTNMEYNLKDKEDSSLDACPVLTTSTNETIFVSANAICTYIGSVHENGSSSDMDDLSVSDFIEWEENALQPIVASFLKSTKKSDPLKSLQEIIDGKKWSASYLALSKCTMADIVVMSTLLLVVDHLPQDTFPGLHAYVNMMAQETAFKVEEVAAIDVSTLLSKEKEVGNDDESMLTILQILCTAALHTAFPALHATTANVTRSKKTGSGEYQCNSAMMIFKKVKSAHFNSPLAVATAVQNALPVNMVIDHLSVAAGFINIHLKSPFLVNRMQSIVRSGIHALPCKKMKIAVDFSSPNIAKDMHVGHLRSTIIGDLMCRILEFQGHDVHRINHVGDWGTQFGMLIVYLKDVYPNWENEMPDIQDLTALYKAAKARFDEDAAFKTRSQEAVVTLQSHDEGTIKCWKVLCDISRREFQKVYDRLGIQLTECGESFYNDKIPAVIELLEKKNLTEDSDGALVVFAPSFKAPLMMRKRDGGFGYDSTDMAALWYRLHVLKADWCIYYTDFSQTNHFKLFFEVSRMAEILKSEHRVNHIGFGTVNDESGKRFKTRSGETVRLVDLLDEAKNRMENTLLERFENGTTSLPLEEIASAAEKIGYGAVKYFDLSRSPTSDYIFSYNEMLSTEGDTAVYLLFAYARFCSIIRKSGLDMNELAVRHTMELNHPLELSLAAELCAFHDTLEMIKKDLMSNRLCNYLYTVASKVQSFTTSCRVLGVPEQNSRLLLCLATTKVMKTCFNLLGIDALEQI